MEKGEGVNMALKPLTAASTEKIEKNFAHVTGKVLPTPKRDRVKNGEDPEAYGLNFMIFGPWGSGKTYTAEGLIRHGFKILFVNTDIGSNGTIAVKMALKNKGLAHLSSQYKIITLSGFKEIEEFITEPAVYFPDFYEWSPDFIFWDGFGYAQQTDIMQKAGEMIVEQQDIDNENSSKQREVSEMRGEGIKFTLADYQVLRNLTVRVVKGFCGIHNKKTGKMIHKIFTVQESMKSKKKDGDSGPTSELVDSFEPMLTGAGGVLTCGAFDLIIRTDKNGDGTAYTYTIEEGKKAKTKKRGFNLPRTMPADFYEVWKIVANDLDIKVGAVDEKNIAPVLLAEEVEG
jgi:hypothetical protein